MGKSIVKVWIIFIFLLSFIIQGCGKAVNPYESEFSCPQAEKGKCVSITQAYNESLRQENERSIAREFEKSGEKVNGKKTKKTDNATSSVRGTLLLSPAEERYVESLYNTLTGLLRNPRKPIITPPKIVRILILPYQSADGRNFYSARYVYIIVDEPKWILQNILNFPVSTMEE